MWKTKVALICLMVFTFMVPEPVLAANFSRVAVPIALDKVSRAEMAVIAGRILALAPSGY